MEKKRKEFKLKKSPNINKLNWFQMYTKYPWLIVEMVVYSYF